MIPAPAREFTDRVHSHFGDDLLSVILVGSFARDDERADSDIDLHVLISNAGVTDVRNVGKIVSAVNAPNEINPTVISADEFRKYPDLNELLKIRHDGIVLYGQLPPDIVPVETELILARRIAHEVLMSSRHYLAVAEAPVSFRNGKLWTYNLKPLSFSARFYHFAKTGCYIRRFEDLIREYPVLGLDPVNNYEAVIEGCVELAEEIMNA